MLSEREKRGAIDRLAQRSVEQARKQGKKLTHETARKDAVKAALRNDRRNQ